MPYSILLLLLVGISFSGMALEEIQFQDYQMKKGFAVVDGNPKMEGALLKSDDILYCESYCLIVGKEKELKINYKGFGRLGFLIKFKEVVKENKGAAKQAQTKKPKEKKEPEKTKIREVLEEEKIKGIFPRPSKATSILHKMGGVINIIPKASCSFDCQLTVVSKNKKKEVVVFKKGQQPKMLWKFSKGTEDSIAWTLKDGEETSQGNFNIRVRSPEVFEKVLSEGNPVEFIN